MKAILLKPAEQLIEPVEVNGQDDIIKLIGYESLIADDVGSQGDKLHFDEDCFLRGTEGRFQIDKLIPVSGNAVIAGSNKDGSLADLQTDIEDLISRIKFL